MSLILEALKKSEAERGSRGRQPATHGGHGGRRAWRWAGATAIALLGIAAGWWGSRQWSEPASPRSASVAAGRAADPGGDAAMGEAMPAQPTPALPDAVSSKSQADGGPLPPPTATNAPAQKSQPSAVVSRPPPPMPPVTAEPAAAVDEAANSTPAEAVASTARRAADGGAIKPESASGERELPRFDQLPALRSEVGELDLNMLVYSAQPEARFALINLRRFAEGDELVPGVKIQEIRRDGVVLIHRGEALLLASGQ